MIETGLRIGIFGGAFDPVHLGHVRVAESFLGSNLIDRLLILPTPVPPHKEAENQSAFEHRFEMLKLAFESYNRVIISDLEAHLPKPSYTLQTIEHLQGENPENTYFLCIGEDNLESFHKWWKYQDILKKVTIIVARRPEAQSSVQKPEILERAIFVEHNEMEISSTEIREGVRENNLIKYVPVPVADYIRSHNLYIG